VSAVIALGRRLWNCPITGLQSTTSKAAAPNVATGNQPRIALMPRGNRFGIRGIRG